MPLVHKQHYHVGGVTVTVKILFQCHLSSVIQISIPSAIICL